MDDVQHKSGEVPPAQQLTSTDEKTKSSKGPGRVAAGRKLVEHKRNLRKEKKKRNPRGRVVAVRCIIKMEIKLSRICHYPKGSWKGLAGVKELVQEAGVFEDVTKLLLMKQAI